jgi:protein SCO1/2
MKSIVAVTVVLFFLFSCNLAENKIPILGNPIETKDGPVYPTIKSFSFVDQDSMIVTNHTFDNKIYVADFFFLSCGTICPKMNVQMKRLYDEFKNNPNVLFLSHTIDTEHDSVPQLKQHALSMGVKTAKWHFVTGNMDSISYMAEHSYYSAAHADSLSPGGYMHSGGFLLIDKNKHVRGIFDGTDATSTGKLINTINLLLKEQFNN